LLFFCVEKLFEWLIDSLVKLLLFDQNEFNLLFSVDEFNEEEFILLLSEPSKTKLLLFSNEEFVLLFKVLTILLDEKEEFESLYREADTEISFKVLEELKLLVKDSPFVILFLPEKT
jgi:hypothetical protein